MGYKRELDCLVSSTCAGWRVTEPRRRVAVLSIDRSIERHGKLPFALFDQA